MKSPTFTDITAIVRLTNECNLACPYCYVGEAREGRMSYETLEKVVLEIANISDSVKFIWHGGEPLLMGIETFKYIKRIQNSLSDNKQIVNSICTNGVLLNKKLVRFFKENDFRVSVSIDGPEHLHNMTRVFPDGSGTHKVVMKKTSILRDSDGFARAIAILTKINIEQVTEIYDFFNKEKINFRINPVAVEPNSSLSISGGEYGEAMIRLYDHIMEVEDGVECKPIDDYRKGVTRGVVTNCANLNCFKKFVGFDPEGNAYNCNRFASYKDMSAGNIHEKPLMNIIESSNFQKLDRNPDQIGCGSCYWKNICKGGCGYESYLTEGTIYSRTPFCEGRKMIFDHIAAREGAVMTEPLPF